MLHDLVYALRALSRTPAFAAMAFLFGVTPADPAALASGCGVLLLAAAAAAYVPARRATRIDPLLALK